MTQRRPLFARCSTLFLFLFPAILLQTQPALAWNAAGHRLCAQIAWQQMDDRARTKVGSLLRRHPDYERWIAHAKDASPDRTAFLEASTWPDDIKHDPRFHDEETAPAHRANTPDRARHRQWHYVDRPLGHVPAQPSKGQLDHRLGILIDTLRDGDHAQRSDALPWLIHLLADAHQPLHVVSRYDEEGRSDEGGNQQRIVPPYRSRRQVTSLHAYWDDLPGPPWLRGERLERAANAIVAEYPTPPPVGSSARWIEESWQIARHSAYPASNDALPTLSVEFHERAQAITRQRIAEAGYRLAALLQNLLGNR